MSANLTMETITPIERRNIVKKNSSLFHRVMTSITRQWKRGRMIKELEAMDDRLLRDIGIERGDIERVVDGFDERELRMVPLAPTPTEVETVDDADRKDA